MTENAYDAVSMPSPAYTTGLPAAAQGPRVQPGGYLTQEVGGGVYVVTDGAFQMMFVVADDEVIAVDAPPTLGANIMAAISEVTPAPVTHVVYTHHHADHIGAASVYPADAARHAHTATADFLARFGDPDRPTPTHVFDGSHTLVVPGQTVQLDYHGPNHSPGNLFVYAPRQRVLMVVDVVFPGWIPFENLAQSSDIPGWLDAHDRILEYSFDTFVGGHLARLGNRDDVLVQQEYLADLRVRIEYESANLDMAAVFGSVSNPANSWALFNAYTDTIASNVAAFVAPRWADRLGGAEVYTKSHAAALAESLRIDYGVLR